MAGRSRREVFPQQIGIRVIANLSHEDRLETALLDDRPIEGNRQKGVLPVDRPQNLARTDIDDKVRARKTLRIDVFAVEQILVERAWQKIVHVLGIGLYAKAINLAIAQDGRSPRNVDILSVDRHRGQSRIVFIREE